MDTKEEEYTAKMFDQNIYGEFLPDIAYSNCSDYYAPVNFFMAMFFPDGVTKSFQESVSNKKFIINPNDNEHVEKCE